MKEGIDWYMYTYYSLQHIKTAAYFARQAATLEREQVGDVPEETGAQHSAYVTGSVFASVAFLEATVNELFRDATHIPRVGLTRELSPEIEIRLRGLWRLENTGMANTFWKYQAALVLAGHQPFCKGKNPYQNADLLVRLRNFLLHFKGEGVQFAWANDGPEQRDHAWDKKLRCKFQPNPFARPNDRDVLSKYLGHGCAKWALVSSLTFADKFFSRIGVKPRYEAARASLSTE